MGLTIRAAGAALLMMALAGGAAATAALPVFIQDGQPKGAIVIDDEAGPVGPIAAADLNAHFKTASGATLPVFALAEIGKIPPGASKIILGPGTLSRHLGVDPAPLGEEGYIVRTVGSDLVLAGVNEGDMKDLDPDEAAATLWAAAEYLDRVLEVRWLWPGELGTHVPRRATIGAPALDLKGRPSLERRWMRMSGNKQPEFLLWLRRHRMGSRMGHKFTHAFTKWWSKYSKQHPEYFAVPPPGEKQMKPDRVKLSLGHPAVTEAILDEWRKAGRPATWNVSPNDSAGFCTSPASMALDAPDKHKPQDVWNGDVSLTRRYVRFWNQLIRKMKAERKDVTLTAIIYQSYRDMPPGLKLEPGIALGVIHGYNNDDRWEEWRKAGARLFLRPNWWHVGGPAPHLPLHRVGDHFKFAAAHGMMGYDFDSLTGFWGTQGPNYFLIARMTARPDLSVEQVLGEYCAAFGPAAPAVKEYLKYWEDWTTKAAYPLEKGLAQDPKGLYETTALKVNLLGGARSPLGGSWLILPHLFTESLMKPAHEILDRAAAAAASGDEVIRKRVKFLKDSLTLFEEHVEVVRLIEPATRRPGETEDDAKRAVAAWDAKRRTFVGEYGELYQSEAIPNALGRWAQGLGF